MIIQNAGIEIITPIDGNAIIQFIERIGRTCYKSEKKVNIESAKPFIANLIQKGHESVIEHFSITVKVTCDRGVSHEIVRHRIASYSQESTRYCNYSTSKFGHQVSYIEPCFWNLEDNLSKEKYQIWYSTMEFLENQYCKLIALGATPEEARTVLPNSLKTEIVMTMNLREWRHFLKLRTAKEAHPQMREIACQILKVFQEKIPIVFDDF